MKRPLLLLPIAFIIAVLWFVFRPGAPRSVPEHGIRIVTESEFGERVLHSPLPVLVDFFADWCYPCRVLSPLVAQLAADRPDQFVLVKVNIDNSQGLARRYGITGLPTLVLFVNGKEYKRIMGLTDEASILALLPQKQ
jgi:thioredoxin 1